MFNLKQELETYLVSSHPFIYAETFEEGLVMQAAAEIHRATGMSFLFWNCVEHGYVNRDRETNQPLISNAVYDALIKYCKTVDTRVTTMPAKVLATIENEADRKSTEIASARFDLPTAASLVSFMSNMAGGDYGFKNSRDEPCKGILNLCVVATDLHLLIQPDDAELLRMIKQMTKWNKAGNRALLMVSPNWNIPIDLQRELVQISVPLPTKDQLRAKLTSLSRHNKIRLTNTEEAAIVESGLALTEAQFENAIAMSYILAARKTISPAHVRKEVDKVINAQKSLYVLTDRVSTEDYVGHEVLVNDMRQLSHAFSKDGQAFKLKQPRGFMLVGPPGNGKTYSGGLLADVFNCRYLRFDIAACKGKYVGETGGNMREALKIISASGRTLVLNDEIEKTLGGSHEMGNTNSVGDILDEYLYQLNSGLPDTIVLMTCNRPDLLPPELVRRLDAIYYLGLPTHSQRVGIFKVHLRKNGENGDGLSLERLADLTKGYSAYEIEKIVKKAKFIAFAADIKNPILLQKHIEAAVRHVRPISEFNPADAKRVHDWARENAINAGAEEESERTKIISELGLPDPVRFVN